MASEMTLKLVFFGLLFLAVALEVGADILFKKWSIESKNILLVSGLAIYFIGTIFCAISLKYEFLSKAISIFTILNLVAVVLVGVIIFQENLSLVNKIGIGFGVVMKI